ncbi:MAG TPA: UDP-N-acetylglucosamine 2-epimerase (non-hydrolyzing) [Anaerohalosphaeraceae bacterium]|nr:UDP-N-acetylglucosamine 2-epimerase (non-hydrolyzing) [Anaerohalosphaeraceae bacterium]HPC64118.1 UDP-N-acetylglucosamine 2-epimerase (non-hydrolyzing) [Anaerohalosphaeraceae bacterium]HRS71504.1 UDP-N-acetylglucosamine 2-epimerase (non-hydrolyzing) [Anaerohalosphaeraceae bacterium]HRV20435.1 UDP-N-acetylglucosamine 2-epimerase (non-hydrolyzing) [Anaerohalosphaeraceae bacterium]
MKVLTILGTRPEIIRLACTMTLLDKHLEHKIVHTGQNYDYELNEIFFNDLNVRKPDHFMNVDTSSLGKVYGGILIKAEEILKQEKPDAVLILGDTNSSIAGIMAKRLKIPIYHMEAGNRCFDLNVPEEINRRIIDHISDFNLCYTEHARRHLLSEGLPHRRIYVTGSPMREVLNIHLERIKASKALQELGLDKGKFFLVSIHREENVDRREGLTALIDAFEKLASEFNWPVIVSTHPRTRKRLETLGRKNISDKIRWMKPFGFLDYVNLQMNAACVLSDSGTICEESSMLGFPAVTVRTAMERPEAMDTGSIVLTGLDADVIVKSVKVQMDEVGSQGLCVPDDYQITNTSHRVLNIILGTAKLSNAWHGIQYNDLV